MLSWFAVIFGALILGVFIGYKKLLPEKYLHWSEKITFCGLALLLWTMGAQIGAERDILRQLNVLGVQAFILAASSVLISVLSVYQLQKLLKPRQRGHENIGENQ